MADYPIYVTLAELREWGPCSRGMRKLLRGITYDKKCAPEDVIIPLNVILNVNGPCDLGWVVDRMIHNRLVKWGEGYWLLNLGGNYRRLWSDDISCLSKQEATAFCRKWLRGRTRNG